jgi:hypothetical protein
MTARAISASGPPAAASITFATPSANLSMTAPKRTQTDLPS